jgi:hypothetical protein
LGHESLSVLLFELDLASEVCCPECGSAPPAVCSRGAFESLHAASGAFDRLGCAGLRDAGHAVRGLGEGTPGLLKFCRIEGWRVIDNGLLASVESDEVLKVEAAEAAGEVAVCLETGVVPGCLGVRT